MKTKLAITALTLCAVSLPAAALAEDTYEPRQRTSQSNAGETSERSDEDPATYRRGGLRSEGTAIDDNARADIRDLMDSTVAAIMKSDFEDLVDNFVKTDRDRIDRNRDAFAALKPAITQLNQNFKSKYNQDFTDDLDKAAASYQISAGTEPKTANVSIASQAGAAGRDPATTLRLVDEGVVQQSWHIDIPNTVDAQQLTSSLQRAVEDLSSQQSAMPADANSGRRMIVQKLLASLSSDSIASMNQ